MECSQLKKLLHNEHKKLRNQLSFALCWIKNYICILRMKTTNIKIEIQFPEIPDIICSLVINMLYNDKKEKGACVFHYLEHYKNHEKLVRKTFENIAVYYYMKKKYHLHAQDILPLDTCECCLNDDNIELKIVKLESFINLFKKIINISESYCCL